MKIKIQTNTLSVELKIENEDVKMINDLKILVDIFSDPIFFYTSMPTSIDELQKNYVIIDSLVTSTSKLELFKYYLNRIAYVFKHHIKLVYFEQHKDGYSIIIENNYLIDHHLSIISISPILRSKLTKLHYLI